MVEFVPDLAMNMTTRTDTTVKTDPRLSQSLNQVLADSYALMALTHLAHWNVEGPGFFALHNAFQQQYEELFAAIDEIAERVRALGAYAIGGLAHLAETAKIQEFTSPRSQEDYVRQLLVVNEKLVADAGTARDLAGEVNDPETEDLMIERITLHQKNIWMLRSFLKS
jgi:starvation-inducible DNA-binding protein